MNTRLLLNIGLLLLVTALVIIAVYEPGHERTTLPLLTGLAPADIQHISIQQHDTTAIVLERSDAGWRVTSPIQSPADETRVQSLLGVAETRSYGRYDVRDIELAKYELDPPKARLRLNDLELAFGTTDPVNHRRYVRTGTEVNLIADLFYHHLITDLSGFVSPLLLPAGAVPVRIRLSDLTLHRTDSGWETVPETASGSVDSVNALVDTWRNTRATRVARHEQRDEDHGDSVEIELSTGTQLRFDLIEDETDLILVRTDLGLEYHLPAAAADRLLRLAQPSESAEAGTDGARSGESP